VRIYVHWGFEQARNFGVKSRGPLFKWAGVARRISGQAVEVAKNETPRLPQALSGLENGKGFCCK